jgi:hypothetical protein
MGFSQRLDLSVGQSLQDADQHRRQALDSQRFSMQAIGQIFLT